MAFATKLLGFIAFSMTFAVGTVAFCNEPSPLFADEAQALAVTKSLEPTWGNPTVLQSSGNDYLGFSKPAFFMYSVDGLKGYMGIAYDSTGKIGLYEVRYPIVKHRCVGVPNSRTLARHLLTQFEPTLSDNIREVNFVGGSADLVWPYTAFMTGPGAIVGRTAFQFYKMNGYCSYRVFRLKDIPKPSSAP